MKYLTYWVVLAFISQTLAGAVVFAQSAVNVQTYDQLVHAIREVQSASQQRIEQAIDQEKVREAWETGKLIDEHILHHQDRAEYGAQVLKKLSNDLGMSHTELKYRLEFFRTYRIGRPSGQLNWAQYEALLSINDDKARQEVVDKAVRQHWNTDQVRKEVQRHHTLDSKETFPSVKPGQVYTYRVVKAAHGPYQGQLGVDLGFSNYFQPDGINQFKEGNIVTLAGAVPEGRQGKLKSASTSEPFTYTAYVTEVIDGDTFHAVVDLGFKFVTEQKLRLRGLDAPEIESADGREAKEFLLAHGVRPGARILVKTVKSDKYDRYLADVWVDGNYINQQLFDEGLAIQVSE